MRYEEKLVGLTRRQNRIGQAIWQRPCFLLAVAAVMSLTDFSTLFAILDRLTVTSKYLGILLTASTAVLLNLTPILAAEALLRESGERWKAAVPGIGFFLLFGMQAFLRWQTRDLLVEEGSSVITFQLDGAVLSGGDALAGAGAFADAAALPGTDALAGAESAAAEISAADTAMCIFLMLLPLCTSLVCFGLALLGNTPAQRERDDRMVLQQKRRNLAAGLEAELMKMDAREKQMDVLRAQEAACRDAALAELDGERKMAEAIAMEELAKVVHADGEMLDEVFYTGQQKGE